MILWHLTEIRIPEHTAPGINIAIIGDNGQAGSGLAVDVATTGVGALITGPCGEVGICGNE